MKFAVVFVVVVDDDVVIVVVRLSLFPVDLVVVCAFGVKMLKQILRLISLDSLSI